ncbi:MAG TPA: hypothetical protein PLJ38_03705 [bacterium]|nr:hypothetical protein [bacterium]
MKKFIITFVFCFISFLHVSALDKIVLTNSVVNDIEYTKFIKEFGALISYSQTLPAESLGLIGFDICANLKIVDINENKNYWQNATTKINSRLIYPQLQITKGLPLDIDVSVMYMPILDADIAVGGAVVKWSFIEGSAIMPAFALRAAYSTTVKKTNFKAEDLNCSISMSKGFPIITPYIAAGMNSTKISDIEISGSSVESKSKSQFNYGAGAKISLGLININASAMFYEIPVYSLMVGFGF